MKKIIALILALVMVMSMSTCCACDCDEQIAALQQEITTLKTQIDEQNQLITDETIPEESVPEETVPEETVAEETVPKETIPEETVSQGNEDAVLEEFLTKQTNSDNPDNWLEVAKCDFAAESNLLEVAKKCATLCYPDYSSEEDRAKQIEIADALSENGSTTDAVMAELVKATYPEVWKVVAKSDKSKEIALLEVAKKCATLCYPDYSSEEDRAKQIEIAEALSNNTATTDAVMAELVNSRFSEVVSFAHQWLEGNR